MWLVSKRWSSLLDGFKFVEALEEQAKRACAEPLRKAEARARRAAEEKHARRMREYETALATWEEQEEERRRQHTAAKAESRGCQEDENRQSRKAMDEWFVDIARWRGCSEHTCSSARSRCRCGGTHGLYLLEMSEPEVFE